jgi:branched-chain amino acid transport system permease protein
MITLAVASAFAVLASQLVGLHRRRGRPHLQGAGAAAPGFRWSRPNSSACAIDGKLITYYLVFFSALALFLLMLRIVNSPFGRVLQAIRENDFRAEALGYRTVVYRTWRIASVR